MKINNIEDLKKNINSSTFWTFFVIFCLSMTGLLIIHNKFLDKQAVVRNQQIISTIRIFESNLSERMSIIASSSAFLDYLRSGEKTRELLYSEFLSQISTLKEQSIVGMKIIDRHGKEIFQHGKFSETYVKLNLCYLNQSLTSEFGICEFSWVLYFNKQQILAQLAKINKSVKICNNCKGIDLISTGVFGSFPIKSSSDMTLNVKVTESKDQFFRIYLAIIFGVLVLSGLWAWFRLSKLLNNHVASPIKNLADCLRVDEVLASQNNIDEIQHLIDEINTWKARVKKANEDEQAVRIGKIAAQLAHDVRSPLMSLDMIVKNIQDIPSDHKRTLNAAVSRISDISNSFLEQYRFKGVQSSPDFSDEILPELLISIVEEKKIQHPDIDIGLVINDDASDAKSKINPTDFARVISNLINNAIEAGDDKNVVKVKLSRSDKFNIISISDCGEGISPEFLPTIFDGVSIGKENGNGLGLSHAKAKVEEWGGEIFIHSEVNKGTVVTMMLSTIEL